MVKPTLYLFFFIAFFSTCINAQNTVIEKIVFSESENIPVENVHVTTSGTTKYTDAKGAFKINFNLFLEFSHVGYTNIRYNNIDEIPDTIWLTRKNTPLDDITINSKRTINKIEKVSGYEIRNFEIINNRVVAFKKSYVGSDTKLSLYDLNGILLNELDFEYNFEDIITSCTGQLYLMDKLSCFLIQVTGDELMLDSKTSRKDFEKLFEKCVLYDDGQWIYEYGKFSGLERNIVSIRKGKDSLLKKIVLDEKILLKRRYQWKIDLGARISNITTNDEDENAYIRDRQEESDFLDKVFLTAHENNSFAVMNEGILIANSLLDSLHFIGDQTIDKAILINKQDFILNNVEKDKTYFFQKNDDQHTLSEISDGIDFQKILTINGEKIFRVRVHGNKVFYLTKESSNKSVKLNLYFEEI